MVDPMSASSVMPDHTLLSQQDLEPSSESTSSSAELMNSFGRVLASKLNQVDQLQRTAQTKSRQFAAGKIDNVHEVSIATQKANMGLQLAGLVRQKVLQGFQQLQQLQ